MVMTRTPSRTALKEAMTRVSSAPPLRLSVTASWSSPWPLTSRRSLTLSLFGILEVAFHDLLEMLARDPAVLGRARNVPAVHGQFVFDVPIREGFQHLLLGLGIGQMQVFLTRHRRRTGLLS